MRGNFKLSENHINPLTLKKSHAQFGVLVLNWGDFKKSSREEGGWLEAKRRLKWNPKNKDSHYSKVMGQSMWPLPKK
jgi:hypothetical protein